MIYATRPINISDFKSKIRFEYDSVIALLNKITLHEVNGYESENKLIIKLNEKEIEIIKNCFDEVVKQIKEWEFQTRIGVTIQEANAIKEKIMGAI